MNTNATKVEVRDRPGCPGHFDITVAGVVVYQDVIGRPAAESARELTARMVKQGVFGVA